MEVCPSSGLILVASNEVPVLTVVRLSPDHRMSHLVEFDLKYPILSMTSLSAAPSSADSVPGRRGDPWDVVCSSCKGWAVPSGPRAIASCARREVLRTAPDHSVCALDNVSCHVS